MRSASSSGTWTSLWPSYAPGARSSVPGPMTTVTDLWRWWWSRVQTTCRSTSRGIRRRTGSAQDPRTANLSRLALRASSARHVRCLFLDVRGCNPRGATTRSPLRWTGKRGLDRKARVLGPKSARSDQLAGQACPAARGVRRPPSARGRPAPRGREKPPPASSHVEGGSSRRSRPPPTGRQTARIAPSRSALEAKPRPSRAPEEPFSRTG